MRGALIGDGQVDPVEQMRRIVRLKMMLLLGLLLNGVYRGLLTGSEGVLQGGDADGAAAAVLKMPMVMVRVMVLLKMLKRRPRMAGRHLSANFTLRSTVDSSTRIERPRAGAFFGSRAPTSGSQIASSPVDIRSGPGVRVSSARLARFPRKRRYRGIGETTSGRRARLGPSSSLY